MAGGENWDKNGVVGTKAARLVDDDIRAQFSELEDALNQEHDFATGNTATRQGRHAFNSGSVAVRDATVTSPQAGNVWYVTDDTAGYLVQTIYDGSTWLAADLILLNRQSRWMSGQHQQYIDLGNVTTVLIGTVYTSYDLANSNLFGCTLTGNTDLHVPNRSVTNPSYTSWGLIIDNTGGYTITFNAAPDYRAPYGVTPSLGTGIHRLQFTWFPSGMVLVESAVSYGAI